MLSPLTKQLIDAFTRLPGVGRKSAQRMVFHLLGDEKRNKGFALHEALSLALNKVEQCESCQSYCETPQCELCMNTKRDSRLLCIVENPLDRLALEETGIYKGHYFVLHGRLSPLEGIGPDQLGISRLKELLERRGTEEVILATNPTVEGKATAHYIASQLPNGIRCTRIAHGVPLGGELEYLDGGTLSLAFDARRQLSQHHTTK